MSVQACSYPRGLAGWVFAAILALATSTASAAVLYQQTPVDGGNGSYATISVGQQAADDFALGGTLESISWWGGYDGNADAGDDDFLVRLYSSVAGTGTVLQEFNSVSFARTSTGLFDAAGNDVYQYDFALAAPLSLSSGTYYLFIQNLGSSDWIWQQGSPGNSQFWARFDDTDSWAVAADAAGQPIQMDLAFALNGTPAQIPEPSSLALLGIAGLSLMLVGWRVRQRQVA